MSKQSNLRADFLDELASVVDGDESTIERFADLLADTEEYRDLQHEAAVVAELVRESGTDYRVPEDMPERVLAAIDVRAASTEAEQPSTQTVANTEESSETEDTSSRRRNSPDVERTSNSTWREGFRRHRRTIGVGFAVAAAGLLAWGVRKEQTDDSQTVAVATALTGTVSQIVGPRTRGGGPPVTIRHADSSEFVALGSGESIPKGSVVRTNPRTRAELMLSDGTALALNQDTEVKFDGDHLRTLMLERGEVVAEVVRLERGPRAWLRTPVGAVEVLGTKFVLTTTQETTSVRVTRGAVRLHGHETSSSREPPVAEVRRGEEGVVERGQEPIVHPAVDIASSLRWSELTPEVSEDSIQGLGELRAHRPGEREERERPLELGVHSVKVRIAGNVARTEIEETFRNDSADVLEGVYRFPLPPDARIASLALEVDGSWEEGAFVAKDRAKKIWRGVIRNATPKALRKPKEEFIWVPGPWRDPALLEWKRGGRFELRIFPIPARGERRIRLAYEQTIAPHGPGRRYVYPLAHSSDGSTKVGRFEVDARISGHAIARGYAMRSSDEGNATRLSFESDQFLPAGDLVIDYEDRRSDAELRFWAFEGPATVPPPSQSREQSPEVVRAQRAIHDDRRAYVALAIRPKLPPWTEAKQSDYVLVLDSSQSMVGERYRRATELVSAMVAEMDRRDRFAVVACDAMCMQLHNRVQTPSATAASKVMSRLSAHRPAGSSDIISALRFAIKNYRASDRPTQVVYIGDGMSSAGYRRLSSISDEVKDLTRSSDVRVTTVGVGLDANQNALTTIAQAGGGHYLRYTPGQRSEAAALAVLETTYGVSLRNVSVRLPSGIRDVAPTELPTIRAGEELIVVGRMNGTVRGDVMLSGTVAGEPFSRRYPVELEPSTRAGNAFVPRTWATATIDKLEFSGQGSEVAQTVALSKAYGVMSRHTSLLVLESEAMFKAFGVDRARPTLQWTGEDEMDSGESNALGDGGESLSQIASGWSGSSKKKGSSGSFSASGADADDFSLGELGTRGRGFGGGGNRGSSLGRSSSAQRSATRRRAPRRQPQGLGAAPPAAAPARKSEAAPSEGAFPTADIAADEESRVADSVEAEPRQETKPDSRAAPRPDPSVRRDRRRPVAPVRPVRPGGRWMKKVWHREGRVTGDSSIARRDYDASAAAESALRENPHSRDRHRSLVRALSRAGHLVRAREVAEEWLTRDRMDPEALTYLSDVVGRLGQRNEALRLLSGIVDLEPDNVTLQKRLANAFRRAGEGDRSCAHWVAMAESNASDAELVGEAVRCERARGRARAASRLLQATVDASVRARAEQHAADFARRSNKKGEIILDARWSGRTDVDLTLVTPQGTRLSWMGGRTSVVGEDARRIGRELLGLKRAAAGSYYIEVSRTDPTDRTPVTGRIEVRAFDERRTLRFALSDAKQVVGKVSVVRRWRLEP